MRAEDLMKRVSKNLDRHKWNYTTRKYDDGDCAINTDIRSRSECLSGYDIRLNFRKWDMQTIYFLPLKAPEGVRREVGEFVARVNWRTLYGQIKFNYSDGRMCCTMMTPAAAIVANVEEVMRDTMDMVRHLDRHVDMLMAVVAGAKTGAEAFAELEAREEAEKRASEEDAPPKPEACAGVGKAPKKGKTKKSHKRGAATEAKPAAEGTEGASAAPAAGEAAGEVVDYSLEGLNIKGKIPLEKIVAAVKKFKAGKACAGVGVPRLNILLSGAPGSGKTAFVAYLARMVGMPLRTVRASDLLSRYSGETESKIAEVFAEAKEDGEILFLDEVDSFLQDRTGAHHSWEVTQVNELLQQMETFGGVLVCATNFVANLDKAVLRRFTYKLTLDYLTNEGKSVFFARYFKTPLTPAEEARLMAIANLTPGDFRTVHEELFYLSEGQTNDERLAALEAESAAKGAPPAKIGF